MAIGMLAVPRAAFGQFVAAGSVTLSNFTGGVFNATIMPVPPSFPGFESYFDFGPPANTSFSTGINLTGAPTSVSGMNQNSYSNWLINWTVVRWWHWTAPADGVAELNAGPLYQSSSIAEVNPHPPFAGAWPIISVGSDEAHSLRVPLLAFSQSTSVSWTSVPAGTPLYMPNDRTSWPHKFRFATVAGQSYHIALACNGNGPYQFTLDLFPIGLLAFALGPDNPLAGDAFPFEFVSSDTNKPVVSLEAFAGTNSLGVATNEPFQFVYTQSQPGTAAIYALGTNILGERVVAFPVNATFRPANDDFAQARPISGTLTNEAFSVDASTATGEAGEPEVSAGVAASHSVWWKWTAHYGVRTSVILKSPDSKVAVYKGNALENLEKLLLVESSTNQWPILSIPLEPVSPPPVSFLAEPGVTYFFQGNASGLISWSLEPQTLELYPTNAQHGNVGWPLEVSAFFYETDSPPFRVEFVLGHQVPTQFFPGYQTQLMLLGSLDAPPFWGTWTPTNVGTYFVWARSTNSSGIVRETPATQFDVYAENDDFARATTIPPETRATNYFFTTAWASAEPGEPSHTTNAAQLTRWWKWTPAHSQRVRFKAVGEMQGFPIDVFTGTNLSDLHRLGSNENRVYSAPYSGIVEVSLKAGQQYYIRTDDTRSIAPIFTFPGVYVTSQLPPADITLTLEPARKPLPGYLEFSLVANTHTNREGNLVVVPIARVFQSDCQTLLAGSSFCAQLYVGTSASSMTAVGVPRPFYSDSDAAMAGLFEPAPVMLPDFVAGQRVLAQIRVWDSNLGSSFEDARANGSLIGRSRIISVKAGSERVGPTLLLGIKSFSLQNALTEGDTEISSRLKRRQPLNRLNHLNPAQRDQ